MKMPERLRLRLALHVLDTRTSLRKFVIAAVEEKLMREHAERLDELESVDAAG